MKILNFRNEKKRRFYTLWLHKDLLGDWVLTRQWGSLDSQLGNCKQEVFFSYRDSLKAIKDILKRRIKRGYIL